MVYFGGLWITLNRFIAGENHFYFPVIVSFVIRIVFVVAGFYALLQMTRQWQALAIALAGFIIARIVITKIVSGNSQTV